MKFWSDLTRTKQVFKRSGRGPPLTSQLAPNLVRAAVEGRLPRGINIERLRDAPAEWSRQFEALGLNPQK